MLTFDERMLATQLTFSDDEQKLLQSSKDAARELEKLFTSDEAARPAQEAAASQA